jgi:uncharacterized protein YjbI with pentapeptide repeats
MKVKNLTPFLFGSKVTSRRPPQPEITLIVKARLTLAPGKPVAPPEGPSLLAQGTMRGDVFGDDDEERAGECLYASDFADFKPQADLLLRGSCHAPGKRPVAECPVRFAVGEWSKILRVVGDRVWRDGLLGASMSDPVPFERMPIDAKRAFGGPGYPQNIAGKGFSTRDLPNVESLHEMIQSRSDRPAPAGYGPISPNRPERRALVGKQYGASYQAKRAPFYAEDFDWAYFNAAAPDQQIPYLRGDEDLVFQNLHPEAPVFSSRLPGLRIRAFLSDRSGRFREAPMRLDTLFADLEEGHLELTWRGNDAVKEDDLSDVKTVLIASEPLAGAPLPESHYRALLDRFEADPLEIEDRLPPDMVEAWQALQGGGAASSTPGADPVSELLEKRLGNVAEPAKQGLRRALEAAATAPTPSGKSLEGLLGGAVRKVPAIAPVAQAKDAATALTTPDPRVKKLFDGLSRNVEMARRSAAARGAPIRGIERWDKLLRDPRLVAAGLTPAPDAARGKPAEERLETGAGADFSGRDLTGRDLSHRDLTGANFTGALLSRTNLAGSTLTRARFRQAVLFEADLRGADLTEADLTAAGLQSALAEGAVFRGSVLDQACFENAKLMGAALEGARGTQSVLSRADLTGALLAGSRWQKAFFEGAELRKADFKGAELTKCLFSKAKLIEVSFENARLRGTSFEDADLSRACFDGVKGDESVWLRAILTEASFVCASLVRTHFTEASALRASFFGANLKEARFYRASLEEANFGRANLFDASLQKANVARASFVDASLYDAKFVGASGAGCDFRGANLKRCTLEQPG